MIIKINNTLSTLLSNNYKIKMGQKVSVSTSQPILQKAQEKNPLSKTIERNFDTFKQMESNNTIKKEDLNLLKEIAQKNEITQYDIDRLRSIKNSEQIYLEIFKNEIPQPEENPKNLPEPKIPSNSEDGQNNFANLVSKMIPIKNLCPKHMIDPLYEHFMTILGEEKIFREKVKKLKIKFFKENLIRSLKKNENVINVFLAPLILESYGVGVKFNESKEVFFKVQFVKENQYLKYLNFVGFTQKIYYYKTASALNEKNPKLKDKNSILIFNSDPKLISKQIYLGIKIYENGKLFAGRFNDQIKLNGRGIYIDKKGNIFLSDFINSEIDSALIYGADNTIYKGKVLNYRKQGLAQCENSEKYEFIGDFNAGKKVKGIYFPKSSNALVNKNKIETTECCVKSIEVNEENFTSLKRTLLAAKIDYYAKYLIKSYYGDVLLAYFGRVVNGKLNDKCILYFDNKKKFPCFEGEFVDNKKVFGKYSWNDKEYYQGKFKDNLFHNKSDTFWDPSGENISTIRAFGREFNIMCEKGKATRLKNIKKLE